MKIAWMVLLISALTDFGNVAAAGLLAAITVGGTDHPPTKWTIIAIVTSGVLAMFRTIQQKLNTTPATIAELTGKPVTVVTTTPDAVTKTGPPTP